MRGYRKNLVAQFLMLHFQGQKRIPGPKNQQKLIGKNGWDTHIKKEDYKYRYVRKHKTMSEGNTSIKYQI